MNGLTRSHFALVMAATMLMTGCAGAGQRLQGIIPLSTGLEQTAHIRAKPTSYQGLHALYVSETAVASPFVAILQNGDYKEIGSIVTGTSTPTGLTLDKGGNLYVANYSGPNVTEYAPGTTSPSFTYSAFMTGPTDVTVDKYGDVYVADGDTVKEYYQGLNTIIAECQPESTPVVGGVAVDSTGDVFVTVAAQSVWGVVEYAGGLGQGCAALVTGVSFAGSYPGGIAVDKNDNLVVGDNHLNKVDVFAPPYTTVTRTIGSGFVDPRTVRLNKANTRAYVVDSHHVTVVNYSTGANITVLGTGNGISSAYCAVDGQNAVY